MAHIRTLRVPGLLEPISHFSDAVIAGHTLYVSGLVATNEAGEDVAKLTFFMRDVAQRPLINPIRQEFFGPHRPASTLVEISRLVRDDLLLEIEAVAQLPDA